MKNSFCAAVFLYAKEGSEKIFLEYESSVLPLLKEYEGELLLRIRPDRSFEEDSKIRIPTEIHLIGFASEDSFRRFLSDPKRKSLEDMQKKGISFSILFQGTGISIPESFYLNNG